jgi:hypothetical protein
MKNKRINKKGVSEVLGYILLVSFAVLMSFIVYQGLKTYVPTDKVECPEGVSIFAKDTSCSLNVYGTYDLNLTIKNNGRYNIAGYFIHASSDSNQTVATMPLSSNFGQASSSPSAILLGDAIIFQASTTENLVSINSLAHAEYKNITKEIYSIDLLPIRFQKEENKLSMVSCGKAILREKINCN